MILTEVLQNIHQYASGDLVRPYYESYCLSKLPSAILALLGIAQPQNTVLEVIQHAVGHRRHPPKVVLLLIDGFGWQQWRQYAERYDFFQRLTTHGVVAPLTTVFPSTTAAALTTVHSGLTPLEHGLPEWWVYFDELDIMAATLPFSPLGAQGRDVLRRTGVKPTLLFQGQTVYQTLARAGTPSFTMLRNAYAYSAYSSVVHKGSTRLSYINSSDMLVNLRQKIAEISGPAYFYVYWDAVDAIAHTYGPHTEQYHAELAGFSYLLQREVVEKISPAVAGDVILIVTADHGHINVSPRDTLYLNRYPRLIRSLQVSPAGKRILPWGSPRDVFLRVPEETRTATAAWLSKRLRHKATVLSIDEALKQGLFGLGKPHQRFRNRVGDLLILPHRHELIWYEHLKGKKFELRGMHGGLTADEMLIPLAVARLSALQ
jgi:predicted AlkP superfamily pyrophosphatase or phosphodiesterase